MLTDGSRDLSPDWFTKIADAPGRHEPGTGEINYKTVLRHLEKTGYKGYVGYELFPLKDTETAVRAIMEEC